MIVYAVTTAATKDVVIMVCLLSNLKRILDLTLLLEPLPGNESIVSRALDSLGFAPAGRSAGIPAIKFPGACVVGTPRLHRLWSSIRGELEDTTAGHSHELQVPHNTWILSRDFKFSRTQHWKAEYCRSNRDLAKHQLPPGGS